MRYILILILTVAAVYIPYHIGELKRQERERIIRKIYNYGDRVVNYIKANNSIALQSSVLLDGKRIDLERVALFLESISIDSSVGDCNWKGLTSKDGNIKIYGSIGDSDKKIDMTLVKRGDRLLVRAIHIDGNSLDTEEKSFPLNVDINSSESNISDKGL